MITLDDYFMGRDKHYTVTHDLAGNAQVTVDRANSLLTYYYADHPNAVKPRVSSGWRPPAVNAVTPGAAKKSKHMTCEAIDLDDDDGLLDDWCMSNLQKFARIGLWLEHPSATKGWSHWQIVPPKSGKRVFWP
jgi:hypothetical protein